MPTQNLEQGGLYVLLFIRSDPPQPNDYHWSLYLHHDSGNGGTKYHIKNQGSGWLADHAPAADILKSFLLVGLFQIATTAPDQNHYVDQKMRAYDSVLNTSPGMTCRIWVLWIMKLLQQPVNGYRILNYDNLDELEGEVLDWGNQHAATAAANQQPRPIGRSRILDV